MENPKCKLRCQCKVPQYTSYPTSGFTGFKCVECGKMSNYTLWKFREAAKEPVYKKVNLTYKVNYSHLTWPALSDINYSAPVFAKKDKK